MFFEILAGIIIFLCALLLYSALRVLKRKGWVLAWLRGMLGLCLVGTSIVLALVAVDLFGYRQMVRDKPIGTISFRKIGEQTFSALVVLPGEVEEREFTLRGDQWQIDARIIRWKGIMNALAKPGYRLDRLSGRYYSLTDERSLERTIYELSPESQGLDIWSWIHEHDERMPWVDAVYGSATFVPMKDGALYEISLTSGGLAARAMNDVAFDAVNQWQ